MKYVIVNADDFGMHASVNRGIIRAFREGILTATSLMANGNAFEEAIELSRHYPALAIGVHLVLVGGDPVSDPRMVPSLVDQHGKLNSDYKTFVKFFLRGGIQISEVAVELRKQIEKILSAGIDVSHLDGHQHLHILPGIIDRVISLAKEYKIQWIRSPYDKLNKALTPGNLGLRIFANRAKRKILANNLFTNDNFFGTAYSGILTESALLKMIKRIPPGVTELMCHPGGGVVEGEDTNPDRRIDRPGELEALLSSRVKAALQEADIVLTNARKLSEEREVV